jgi:hypothetical protein
MGLERYRCVLRAGLGYGGSCFPKCVAALRHVAEERGVDFGLLEEVSKINDRQLGTFHQKIRSALWDVARQTTGDPSASKCEADSSELKSPFAGFRFHDLTH